MNKNAIQKYAVWARNELIEQIKQRAYQYGISEKGFGDENAAVISGRVLSAEEKKQRHEFVAQIKEHGYQQAVEEVAYTWFNRFVALRYMEVNDYLPTHVRVLSDASGNFNPEILKDVLHLELNGLNKSKVSEMLNDNQAEDLYRYMLLTQCNALNAALPEMFEKLGSYTEMLLPNNILKTDSVIGRLVKDIPEEDWRDAVQIIGWMYQYYNTEPKQAVFEGLKKNIKITKEKIPAATQLFTPDWIVRYMVENSLGRIWLESHPNDALKTNWKYYLDEAEQTLEVTERLRVLRSQSPIKSPEDIRLIDPCMGSGHILVYAFDVLMQIYQSEGYNPRDAVKLILEKNIYGLDIDRRAYQLAYFSLMMKARQYNRRLFTEDLKPQVYYPAGWSDGEEYGSLVKVDTIPPMPELSKDQLTVFDDYERDLRIWSFKRLLAQKYDVVITNPPYARSSGLNIKLSDFLKDNYPDTKSDMFSAFIVRCLALAKHNGFATMITQQAWMFLGSYEKLRLSIIGCNTITSMVHLGNGSFGFADFGLTTFVIRTYAIPDYIGSYIRLVDDSNPEWKKTEFLSGHHRYKVNSGNFSKIPGSPTAYWVGSAMLTAFENGRKFEGDTKKGVLTGNDDEFVRLWFEVLNTKIGFNCTSHSDMQVSRKKWFPKTGGGSMRKWYGNFEDVVNLENDGAKIKATVKNYRLRDSSYYMREAVTWTEVTLASFTCRYVPQGILFGNGGPVSFFSNDLKSTLGLLNSKVTMAMLKAIAPTINFGPEQISKIPIIKGRVNEIDILVRDNIALSRTDWDSFETSWDFKRHPLLIRGTFLMGGKLEPNKPIKTVPILAMEYGIKTDRIATAFKRWEAFAAYRFDTLKANEEELNSIFIDIYGLADEQTPEVEDKDVTVRPADLGREIRSFISYAVGCMFGRYSLDMEGLAYAGGDWDAEKYKSFIPDKDNVLPICDDEYFDDDILGRFVDFVRMVYSAETLEENLKFISDAIGGRGTPREVIRNYFLNEFYTDHCKIYQKRPIYWLFDSGNQNGFKALIYLHRYSRDLLAKLRTDYVHEQQERYRTQLSHITAALNTATGAERAQLLKQQDKLSEQLKEITAFEEKAHHLADQNIEIDLDDGVKKNYEIFADVLAKI